MAAIKRIIIIIVAALILFPLLYFTAVLAGGLLPAGASRRSDASDVEIFLQNNGRHIDIWLPAEICGPLFEGRTGWLSFGWGDRDFYLSTPYAEDLELGILLKALFLPSRAVLAVEFSESKPLGRDLRAVKISQHDVEAAWKFISSYFIPDSSAAAYVKVPAVLVHPSYGEVVFYESRGLYSIFHTCNNWTSRALKAAGVKTGLWTPLTFGVYID